jgi:hypothetical protein
MTNDEKIKAIKEAIEEFRKEEKDNEYNPPDKEYLLEDIERILEK